MPLFPNISTPLSEREDLTEIIKIVNEKGAKLLVDDVSGFAGYNMDMLLKIC